MSEDLHSETTTTQRLKKRVAELEQQLHEPGYVDALRGVVEEVGLLVPRSFRERPEIHEEDFDMLEALPDLVGKYIEHLKDTSAVLKELKEWRTANPSDEDRPLPEDPLIDAARPLDTGLHDLYAEAVRMVGAKHSKYALVDLVNWLLVQNECLKALHGRPLTSSQREMVRRGDLKGCKEAGEQSEAYARELAKTSANGVARVRLRGDVNPTHDITVFFPVREGLGFDPDRLQGSWPLVRGTWDVSATGEMSFDEEGRTIVIEWSNGDTTRTKLRGGSSLKPGRVLPFESVRFGRTNFIITEVERL